MHEKNLNDILKSAFYTNARIITFATAFYLGVQNSRFVRRVENSFVYREIPFEEKSFTDPYGLDIKVVINQRGRKEVYLVHDESGKKILLGEDMLPAKSDELAKGLAERLGINLKELSSKYKE